jgi:hypothetical protein
MKRISALLLIGGAAISVAAQGRPPLEVVPLFTNVGFGPAFMLTCVNDTGAPVHMRGFDQLSVRLDGKPIEQTGFMETGGDPVVQPGGRFKMMFTLHQEPPTFWMSADFGAIRRSGRMAPMPPGPHSVEFNCLGQASGTIPFVWEHATAAK